MSNTSTTLPEVRPDFKKLSAEATLDAGFILTEDDEPLPEFPEQIATDETLEDQTHIPYVSIDNVDTQDIDQLSYCEKLPSGDILVRVAIADVAHRVARDDALDKRAYHNTTTLYLYVRNVWMFPKKMCCGETSLLPHIRRRALVTTFTIDISSGEVKNPSFCRAWVRNAHKLDYESVGKFLETGVAETESMVESEALRSLLRLHDEAAQVLRRARQEEGSLPFLTARAEPILDGEGYPVGIRGVAESNRAHRIIEHLMIATNTQVVLYLQSKGFYVLHRIVKRPRQWARIVELTRDYGWTNLSVDKISVKKLQAFLKHQGKIMDPDEYKDLSTQVIMLMGRGEYCSETGSEDESCFGHFALALGSYTHSTAPNRRYPDVINQRMMLAALAGKPSPYSKDEMQQIAMRCTQMEDKATKLERRVTKMLLAEVLKKHLGEVFEARVYGRRDEKGEIWVRIISGQFAGVEGRMFCSKPDCFKVSEMVTVRLVKVKPEKGFIDFAKVLSKKELKAKEKKKQKQKQKQKQQEEEEEKKKNKKKMNK